MTIFKLVLKLIEYTLLALRETILIILIVGIIIVLLGAYYNRKK